ncbi:hypothetical protein BW727_100093 [Jeotgalibaca dankookensis]|uniref:Uncharacterized protein n=1 Tax=Jeotgalibaca dankookensis TaxID=708126 RepID=A0A1S6ILS2_9LACT|nr:helix-turn-helix transcriptional regulator [Jeotgalibaca dankookensis]AQS52503.1 hypothetical protein BW727_100093 [Jeotgalibaca dankookensis]
MDTRFNSKMFFDNIYFLIKKRNEKIGDLESTAGVSTGYISRTSKESGAKPGIDFIISVASYLKISIDTLLTVDLSSLTPTELYLVSFFEKLKSDTVNDKLGWEKNSSDSLNYEEPDLNGVLSHPLMNYETFYDLSESEYPEEVTRNVMVSNAFGHHTVIAGDCFSLNMANNTTLHLMNICKTIHKVNDPNARAVEVWMTNNSGSQVYIGSNMEGMNLKYIIDDLYQTIVENLKYPKLNDSIRFAIESYMEKGIQPNDIDYSDLPF